MAGVLRSFGSLWSSHTTISFLVVADSGLCERISDALHAAAKEKTSRIVVHQCELVAQVLKSKPNLCVDFIVFAVDGRLNQANLEAEKNINLVDELYISSGRSFLIYCHGKSNIMSTNHYETTLLAKKYNIRHFLMTNIHDLDNALLLGKRLLNSSEGILNFKTGLPMYHF